MEIRRLHSGRLTRRIVALLFATLSASSSGSLNAADGPPAATRSLTSPLETRLQALEGLSIEHLWDRIHEIRAELTGSEDPQLAEFTQASHFAHLPDRVRFAASTLVRLSQRRARVRSIALSTLADLAQNSSELDLQMAALAQLGEARELWVVRIVEGVLGRAVREDQSHVVISASAALDRLDNTASQRSLLRLLESDSHGFDVHARAALTWSQTSRGNPLDPRVRPILETLRSEPTERGRLARWLLSNANVESGHVEQLQSRIRSLEEQNQQLQDEIDDLALGIGEGSAASDNDAIHELLHLIRREFIDPGRVDGQQLATEAIRSMVENLEYARFYSVRDVELREARRLSSALRLGADFFKLDRLSPLVVARVDELESDDATSTRTRLRPGDRINAIYGVPTRGVTPAGIRQLLSQTREDALFVELERWGWETPRIVEIEKGKLPLPSAIESILLPASIGYVRVRHFESGSAERLERTLLELDTQADGALRGLVLDLRNNRGGQLTQGVRAVDLFVENRGQPIVSQVRPDGRRGPRYFASQDIVTEAPLVILVNDATASTAEVVCGALQDFGRARLVGRRTFGKGVSQRDFKAPASVEELTGGPATLRLPNYYLTLPSGRKFHRSQTEEHPPRRGGIDPDVTVADLEESLDDRELDEYRRVQYSDEVFEFIRERYSMLSGIWEESPRDLQAIGDSAEFERLYADLRTSLGRDTVLVAVVRMLLRHFGEHPEDAGLVDLRADRPLRRALQELGVTASTSAEYARLLPLTPDDD